jgi:hypothetical protein
MKLTRRVVDTAQLATVDETVAKPAKYRGQFVRVRPTANATDADVAAVKARLVEAGAAAVRVLPRPPKAKAQLGDVADKVERLKRRAGGALPPTRELVASLVEQSTAIQHKDDVRELLEELADEVGL